MDSHLVAASQWKYTKHNKSDNLYANSIIKKKNEDGKCIIIIKNDYLHHLRKNWAFFEN